LKLESLLKLKTIVEIERCDWSAGTEFWFVRSQGYSCTAIQELAPVEC
jgi:hypothetical protein